MINSPPNFGVEYIAKPRNAETPTPPNLNLAVESGCRIWLSNLAAQRRAATMMSDFRQSLGAHNFLSR